MNTTPEIFSTLKRLPEDKKQMINNWVRETHGRPNVAIWSVKCNPSDRDELNGLISQAIDTDNWSHFETEEAKGQAGQVATNPEPEPVKESEPEPEPEVIETATTALPETPVEIDLNSLLEAEVTRRLDLLKDKIRTEILSDIRKVLENAKN